MQFDPALQSNADNYKLLTNLVVPRPIAWVTSQSQSGIVNLARIFHATPLYDQIGADLGAAGARSA